MRGDEGKSSVVLILKFGAGGQFCATKSRTSQIRKPLVEINRKD